METQKQYISNFLQNPVDKLLLERTTLTSKLPGSNVEIRREGTGNIEPKAQTGANDTTGEYRNYPTMQGQCPSKTSVLEPIET